MLGALPRYVITVDEERYDGCRKHLRSALGWDVVRRFDGIVKPKVGCTLTHLKLWEQHAREARRRSEAMLVFEDDARLCRPIDDEDERAVARFLDDESQGLMLLGWHPHLHRMRDGAGRAKRGIAVDAHAYIIKAGHARYLLDRWAAKMRSRLHQAFAPTGAIDCLFLLEPVTMLDPMLFVQDKMKRYENPVAQPYHPVWFQCFVGLSYAVFYKERLLVILVVVLVVVLLVARGNVASKRPCVHHT